MEKEELNCREYRRCEFWDSGWCFHPSKAISCVGQKNCTNTSYTTGCVAQDIYTCSEQDKLYNFHLGIDQSLSKCAFCVMDEMGKVVYKEVVRTGDINVKTKKKGVFYYDSLQEQIHHLCLSLKNVVEKYHIETITFEALSFGSAGNATRNLACLYGALRETVLENYPEITVYEIQPTKLKKYAREFLPEHMQQDGTTKAGKPKLIKMDKKLMVAAIRQIYGEDFLKEYNYSTGLDDLADATFLVKHTLEDYA